MEFEKFRERKEYGLRVALIDLIEKQQGSEKYISVMKTLSEKKEDISNIDIFKFIQYNYDLKLTQYTKDVLYKWGYISMTDFISKINYIIGKEGITEDTLKIILSLIWNKNIKHNLDLKFKKFLVDKCYKYQDNVKDFGTLGMYLTRYGQVDIELMDKIFTNEKLRPNLWFISANDGIELDAIDKYSESEIDWLSISYRKRLTREFVKKHIDKLCLDIIILNNPSPSILRDCIMINFRDKFNAAVLRMIDKSDEVIKSECHIRFHFEKINGGWNSISKSWLMSDDFMMENWDNLNKDILKKYRKLSPRIQALL